jgi:hypothetical protein
MRRIPETERFRRQRIPETERFRREKIPETQNSGDTEFRRQNDSGDKMIPGFVGKSFSRAKTGETVLRANGKFRGRKQAKRSRERQNWGSRANETGPRAQIDLAGGKQTGVRRTGSRTHAGEKQETKTKTETCSAFILRLRNLVGNGSKTDYPSSQQPHHTFYSGSDKLMKVEAFCQNDFVS